MKYDKKSKSMDYSNKEIKKVHGFTPHAKALEKAKGGMMSRPEAEKKAVKIYKEGAAANKRLRKY